MRERTLAHLSDLHFGAGPRAEDAAARLVQALLTEGVDHVVVTGDVTHRGRRREADRFRELFAPLARLGKLTVVPGNHDRLGDDVREALMTGPRVQTEQVPGLYLVRVDSTGPHNRRWVDGHGELTPEDIAAVDGALARAPEGALRAVLLHHHVLPLPEEDAFEKLVTWLGWPQARELAHGGSLLARLRGRCPLVLHGHRHVPAEAAPFAGDPLAVYNAGSTTLLERFRVFAHRDGLLAGAPRWVSFARRPANHVLPGVVRNGKKRGSGLPVGFPEPAAV